MHVHICASAGSSYLANFLTYIRENVCVYIYIYMFVSVCVCT